MERLRDPSRLLHGEDPKARAPGLLPVTGKQAASLSASLRTVKDPRSRRGRQFPLGAMLATAVLAQCCGESTVTGIFRFCQDLSSPQRASLDFRSNPQARKVVPPPGAGCWRKVLAAVAPKELAVALDAWLQNQCKDGDLLHLRPDRINNRTSQAVNAGASHGAYLVMGGKNVSPVSQTKRNVF